MVYENVCLALTASPSPLAVLFPYGLCTTASIHTYSRAFTLVKDGATPPRWCSNHYPHPTPKLVDKIVNLHEPVRVKNKQKRAGGTAYPARMRPGDGYRLVPLLTPNKDGSQTLRRCRACARARQPRWVGADS